MRGAQFILANCGDEGLGVSEILRITPLLIGHHKRHRDVQIAIRRTIRSVNGTKVADLPVHEAIRILPLLVVVPKLVELRLSIIRGVVHIHHDEHAVANALGNGVRRIIELYTGIITALDILIAQPVGIRSLNIGGHRACASFTLNAVGIRPVAGKGEIGSRLGKRCP